MTTTIGDVRLPARFWTKVELAEGGCWTWTACKSTNGYAKFGLSREEGSDYGHRVAYTALRGPIESGLVLDHLCRNRACVNPEHLEAVTYRENTMRGKRSLDFFGKCTRGHDVTQPDSLYFTPAGQRCCRACIDANNAKRTAAAREARGYIPGLLKSHCARGHLFDEANTYVPSDGKRRCRTCSKRAMAEFHARRKAAKA